MDMDITTLFDAGLTVNEARVYLTLLKLGSASVTEITKESKVHRVNVYDVIERLLTKGLISSILKANKQFYEAASPDNLLHLLDSKRENIKEALPEMKLLYEQRKDRQEIHYFKGPQGVFNAYNMILEQGETLYAIGGSGYNREILKHRHKIWDQERIKRKINVKAIYYESLRATKKTDKERLWETRFIANEYQSNLMIDICGDLSIILFPQPKKEDILAVVIESRGIADGYRKQFEFMWKNASL